MRNLLLCSDIEESKKDIKNIFRNTTTLQLHKIIFHRIHKVPKYLSNDIIGIIIEKFKFRFKLIYVKNGESSN